MGEDATGCMDFSGLVAASQADTGVIDTMRW